MFRGLRLRLTLLYLLAALLLLVLVGAAAYVLLRRSFQSSTDLALRQRAAQEFRQFGVPLPPELAAVAPTAGNNPSPSGADHPEAKDSEQSRGGDGEETYRAELAAIFVFPLSADGTIVPSLQALAPPLAPDRQAALAALRNGSDLRTTRLGATNVRLLSYHIPGPNGLAVLQLGRTLSDQQRFLTQLLVGLLILGGASTVLLGAGSWVLAGRSIRPAQESWERQRVFVANASHELRTPLTLLRASAEVAQRHLPAGETEGRALLDDVLRESDHMARLVEDLLLLSKLDASSLTLHRQAVALPALLADLQRQVGRLAEERGIHLIVEGGAGGAVWADPARLRQILLIFLDNALRHTPAGGTIRISTHGRGREIQLTVADTGSGIAPEDLPHLFERFYQSDRSRFGSAGSGLGLAIAKALVDAHGGEIRLTSRPGEGTRVTVTLPHARTQVAGT